MRADVIGFVLCLLATLAAARWLPGWLGLPSGVVQDRILMAALPLLVIFIWRSRSSQRVEKNDSGGALS